MQIGMIGLGRMGANMAHRLSKAGVQVFGFDRSEDARKTAASEAGLTAVDGLAAFAKSLQAPRIVWVMLPAGAPTETTLQQLAGILQKGDLIVDGANAHFKDSQRHAKELAAKGIDFVDAGVSGGIWGLQNGYGLMVGGEAAAVARVTPILKILAPAPDQGWVHCGAAGAGHYAKMVHNGIEYGLMQAYAEGFALMEARREMAFDIPKIAEAWRYGTVIRSWLLDLTAEFLAKDSKLDSVEPYVADSGEGRWTSLEAIEAGVPTPVMNMALLARFSSQGKADYTSRLLAKMRQGFGGHAIKTRGG